jgi:hypothetical protein
MRLGHNKGASAGYKENMLNNEQQAGAAKRAGPSSEICGVRENNNDAHQAC